MILAGGGFPVSSKDFAIFNMTDKTPFSWKSIAAKAIIGMKLRSFMLGCGEKEKGEITRERDRETERDRERKRDSGRGKVILKMSYEHHRS